MTTRSDRPAIAASPGRLRTLLLAAVLAGFATGCGASATGPEEENEPSGPQFTDVPPIPQPSTPGGDVPATSAVLTRVEKLDGAFRPYLAKAYGVWSGREACPAGATPQPIPSATAWSSGLGGHPDFGTLARILPGRRLALQDSTGQPLLVSTSHSETRSCGLNLQSRLETEFVGEPIESDVFVRRDRQWRLRPLEADAGDYLLVYPGATGEVISEYTSGSEVTETEEFGRSITAEAGLTYGALSAAVSATLSESFSSSVTISESTTEQFIKSVSGTDGKLLQFMVWELVETYSFTDESGEPLTFEHYEVMGEVLVRNGAAVALQSTEFDLP